MIFVAAGDSRLLNIEFNLRRDPWRSRGETVEAKR